MLEERDVHLVVSSTVSPTTSDSMITTCSSSNGRRRDMNLTECMYLWSAFNLDGTVVYVEEVMDEMSLEQTASKCQVLVLCKHESPHLLLFRRWEL